MLNWGPGGRTHRGEWNPLALLRVNSRALRCRRKLVLQGNKQCLMWTTTEMDAADFLVPTREDLETLNRNAR